MATRNNNGDWLGGLIFCLFPLALFIRSFIQPLNLELGVWALMILFFITGINLMVTAMFKLETKVVAKAITGGIYGVGFGLVAILIGWSAKTGWSGSWQNLLPDSWTQTIPRALFLAGGIGCCALGLSSFRNAYRKWGLNNDQENENARLAAEAEEKRREAVWKDPKGKKGAYFLLLIVILFTGGPGLICLSLSARNFFIAWQSKHWAEVEGVVESVKVDTFTASRLKGSDHNIHRLAMDYDYSVAGKTYVGHRVSAGDSGDEAFEQANRYPAGTRVTVRYSPANPASALLEPRVGGAILPLLMTGVIFSAIGAIFVVTGIKAWRLR